ncbi:MAG: hypothetical protein ACRYGL_12265 [Janthinobacterium lividum]
MPLLTVTSFKQPPWHTYERESSRESSPAPSRAGTPPPTRRSTPLPTHAGTPPSMFHALPTAPARATSPSDEFGGMRFSTDILDLSHGDAPGPSPGLAKLERALQQGDGRVAGLWVRLPNDVLTPMIVRHHGRTAIELVLIYEKRQTGDAPPIDRAALLKRLKTVLTANTKATFKAYGQVTEVWKSSQETADACHRRITDELHWHASAGRSLRKGLVDEQGLREAVGDPGWERLQKQRAARNSLGFVLPEEGAIPGRPGRGRDDTTKVVTAKIETGSGVDVRRTAATSVERAQEDNALLAALASRRTWHPSAENRPVLLDIRPLAGD